MSTKQSVFSGRLKQFENHPVTPLTPWAVNTFLVRGERPILVDTGMPSDADKIQAALTENSVSPADLSLILITHGHYDHFGGAAQLQSLSKASVAVHRAEAHRLENGERTPVQRLTWMGYLLDLLPASAMKPTPLTPDVLLAGDEALDDYGVDARLIPTPGHTAHSVSLLVGEVAIIGDLLAGSFLFPNRPEWPYFIDDPEDKVKIRPSVEHLVEEGTQIFFPGHGLPFDRASVKRWLSATKGR